MSKIKYITQIFTQDTGLKEYFEDFALTVRMLKDYAKGNYKKISLSSKLIVIFALVYIVSPIDIIPGFIPVLGKLDDISVVIFALNALKEEREMYRLWLAVKDSKS